MATFRVDYLLSSDLVLDSGAAPPILQLPGPCSITFRNAAADDKEHVPGLIASVVGQADSFDVAEPTLREHMLRFMDTASFCTRARFRLKQAVRLMEWEPGQRERRFKAFGKFDPLYPPTPELSVFLGTVEAIANDVPDGSVVAALRSFRLGVIADDPQDQFQRFWFAVETVAEHTKPPVLESIICTICNGSHLECPACGASPLRRPMARQAIFALISRIFKGDARILYRMLIRARDGFIHGASRASIEKKCGCSISDLVNQAGLLAFHSLRSCMTPRSGIEYVFADREGQLVAQTLIVGPVGSFTHDGPEEHPPEDKLPEFQIGMIIELRENEPAH